MAQIHRIVGGVAGLGGTLGARMFLDEPGADRFSQPSVMYGLGTGALATALWGIDTTGTVNLDSTLVRGTSDFFASHAATALPAGGASALLPKTGNSGGGGDSQSLSSFFNEQAAGQGSRAMTNGGQDMGDYDTSGTDYADAN